MIIEECQSLVHRCLAVEDIELLDQCVVSLLCGDRRSGVERLVVGSNTLDGVSHDIELDIGSLIDILIDVLAGQCLGQTKKIGVVIVLSGLDGSFDALVVAIAGYRCSHVFYSLLQCGNVLLIGLLILIRDTVLMEAVSAELGHVVLGVVFSHHLSRLCVGLVHGDSLEGILLLCNQTDDAVVFCILSRCGSFLGGSQVVGDGLHDGIALLGERLVLGIQRVGLLGSLHSLHPILSILSLGLFIGVGFEIAVANAGVVHQLLYLRSCAGSVGLSRCLNLLQCIVEIGLCGHSSSVSSLCVGGELVDGSLLSGGVAGNLFVGINVVGPVRSSRQCDLCQLCLPGGLHGRHTQCLHSLLCGGVGFLVSLDGSHSVV